MQALRTRILANAAAATWLLLWHIQDLTHLANQGVRRERFVQKRQPRVENAVPHDRFLRVTREEKDLDVRTESRRLLQQLTPAGSADDHVGRQQMDWPRMLLAPP